MVSKEEVERLASLARLEVVEDKKEALANEMSAIVDFVSQVQEITTDATPTHNHSNIFREDGEPHASGAYTDELLKSAQTSNGKHIVVPKIISND